MPAVNLSNRLNPNNIHYDRELAARYKRMSKPEKEALWARDREMQKQKVGTRICLPSTTCKTWTDLHDTAHLCNWHDAARSGRVPSRTRAHVMQTSGRRLV